MAGANAPTAACITKLWPKECLKHGQNVVRLRNAVEQAPPLVGASNRNRWLIHQKPMEQA